MLSSKAARVLLLGGAGGGAVTLALSTSTSASASETTAGPSVRHVVEDKVSVCWRCGCDEERAAIEVPRTGKGGDWWRVWLVWWTRERARQNAGYYLSILRVEARGAKEGERKHT